MEDAETGTVQSKAAKPATAIARHTKGPHTAVAPPGKFGLTVFRLVSPLESVDHRCDARSSDADPIGARRHFAVLYPFLWGLGSPNSRAGELVKRAGPLDCSIWELAMRAFMPVEGCQSYLISVSKRTPHGGITGERHDHAASLA